MGLWDSSQHVPWRNRVPTTIGIVDTETGNYRDVIRLDYHVHHVFFADNRRLLVNHVKGGSGLWMIHLDGTGMRTLRPQDKHGAIVHQVITQRGVFYEAVSFPGNKTNENWLGLYNLANDKYEEVLLPATGYLHTGYDPAGEFLFFENSSNKDHELYSLHFPFVPGKTKVRTLRTMATFPRHGQRHHAHPFLSPDRQWLFYTEIIDGLSQVCALDVRDLVDLDEYWDRRA
jgi:hypothetical protein